MTKKIYQSNVPFLSVGLAFYNVEKTVACAVKSVLMQTYGHFEFIIIDDGSTDNSFAIVQELAKTDNRIKLIRGEKNMGVGFRLNQITDLAKGEYIVRMDADDLFFPDKVERQMAILLADKNLDLIDCSAYIIDKFGTPVGIRKANDISNLTLRKILKSRTVFFHPTVIAKTAWFRKFPYDESFRRGPDFELWCRSFGNTNYTRLDEPLFIYREGKVSIKNYQLNMASFRRSLTMYYAGALSSYELKKEIAMSHVKGFLYWLFGSFKMQHLLTATRNSSLTEEEKEKVSGYLEFVEKSEVGISVQLAGM